VFVLHLYDRALLNRAALRVLGYDEKLPEFPAAEVQRDSRGNPTGMLIANPNATILYATLAQGPTLTYEDQLNSTRLFMRELNRLGVTSAIDAGGGWQNYPEDYRVISDLHERGEMTVRIAYNLFTQRLGQELDDFAKWVTMTAPDAGDDFYRVNGAGEMLVFSAADFEDFLKPRPNLPSSMEDELYPVVRLLSERRWPWRIHATYEESITRFLDVFERVNREVPFDGLRFFLDHGETISERSIERLAALGGGLAIQHRMAFQGEYFIERYGAETAAESPPIQKVMATGTPGAPTRHGWPRITPGSGSTGWCRDARSAARSCIPPNGGWTGWRRCVSTRRLARGSLERKDARERLRRVRWRISRCCQRTTSR
jgi:predicted amidohydrolase YtcJ